MNPLPPILCARKRDTCPKAFALAVEVHEFAEYSDPALAFCAYIINPNGRVLLRAFGPDEAGARRNLAIVQQAKRDYAALLASQEAIEAK